MSLILWLAKLQWSILVDHLTYEKLWSVEKLSLFLIGLINISLLTISVLHHSFWLIPLITLNVLFLFSAMKKQNVLENFLISCGFKKQQDILAHFQIKIKAKDQSKKKVNTDNLSVTSNRANIIILNFNSTFNDNLTFCANEIEFNKSELQYYNLQN